MKRTIIAWGIVCGLITSPVMADHLKESLSGMLKQKEQTPSMVNLDGIDLAGKRKHLKPKSRSAKAVIATVNGKKIRKKEADAYLAERTNGKIKDFDMLPKKQRLSLIKELSLPMILAKKASADFSDEEKDALISRAWMQNAILNAKVPDVQIKAAYDRIKAQAKAKSALAQLPPFEKIKDRIRMQIAEQQIIRQLMRGVEVKVDNTSDKVAGYAGMIPIYIDDVNKALARMTKGKMTWATLPPRDRLKVLNMIAPSKLITLSAKNALSQKQKDTVLANVWMQKKLSEINVSDEEAKKRYNKLKTALKKAKSKKKLPEFSKIERNLKMEIAREKLVKSLTKNAKIQLK